MNKPSLVILDRDGVINQDRDDYVKSPDEWVPIEGSLQAISALNQAGIKVVVATNQSGVGRGYFDCQTLEAMHQKMQQLLHEYHGWIDHIYVCPHRPEDECDCRKPKPGLYLKALSEFCIPSQLTLVVGDSYRDIAAAHAARCVAVLVKTGKGERTSQNHQRELQNVPVFNNLKGVIKELLR